MSDKKQSDNDASLPPGVAWVSVDHEGRATYQLDPFLRDMRWKGVRIDSSTFKGLPFHEQLFQQSRAFLHAALVLCEEAGDAGREVRWPQGSVCYYCLHLATELFLKTCILRVSREPVKLNHYVADLLKTYRNLLPGSEFDWPTPWWASPADLADIFGHKVLRGVDRTPDQLYRYGADKAGTSSEGV